MAAVIIVPIVVLAVIGVIILLLHIKRSNEKKTARLDQKKLTPLLESQTRGQNFSASQSSFDSSGLQDENEDLPASAKQTIKSLGPDRLGSTDQNT